MYSLHLLSFRRAVGVGAATRARHNPVLAGQEARMRKFHSSSPALAAFGMAAVVLTLATTMAQTMAQRGAQKKGSPEEQLPSNIKQLTAFGERASWSPDGTHIAFMSKSFGDAFVVDVHTKMIRLLTHYPNAGFLRVQYLPNGDYFLIGARTFTDIRTTRGRDQEMWVLGADGKGRPVALDHKISEGVAISRKTARIAWSNTHGQHPDLLADGESVIYIADIVYEGGQPKLANKKEVLRAKRPECTLEAQDFRRNDTELIYTCYRSPFADVFGIDLNTSKVTTYRKLAGEYNEVEGIFPDGEHVLVESSREQAQQNSNYIDIWKLKLEPESTNFVRMTRWGDYPNYKASNPVVSPDGWRIAFQSARSTDEAGVGYGIFLLDLRLR
jgi:Tol biopolymer transport system component